MKTNIEEIQYYIEQVSPQKGLSEILDRYLRIQTALQGIGPIAIEGVKPPDLKKDGIPLIKGAVLKVDSEKVKEGVIKVCKALGIGFQGDLEIDTDLSSIMEGLLKDGDFPSDIFSFLLMISLKPTLLRFKDALSQTVGKPSWSKGYCPFCGSWPSFALLTGEGGRRRLYCNLCETLWDFKRVACPCCGNEDQESMSYFYTEEEDAYRVDTCQRCMTYLKTLDTRKMAAKGDLGLEDLITLPLDIIAQERGLHRMAANPLGMRGVLGKENGNKS